MCRDLALAKGWTLRNYSVNLIHQINRGRIKTDQRVIDLEVANLEQVALTRQAQILVVRFFSLSEKRQPYLEPLAVNMCSPALGETGDWWQSIRLFSPPRSA